MTLTPARRDYLRHIRGEHMEGVEVVTITRTDLDALLEGPRTINTVEELDALPLRSVVLDGDSEPWELVADGWRYWVYAERMDSGELTFPATVLYTPADPR